VDSDHWNDRRLLELVEDPREILEQKTSSGEKIYGYYEKINERYREMLSEALKSETDNGVIIHIFEDPLGITSSISNYLAYKYPDHLIVIGRKHRKGVNFSLRHQGIDIRPILTKAIEGLDAIGGGHEHACGASIKERDLEVFLERIKKYYNTNKYFQY